MSRNRPSDGKLFIAGEFVDAADGRTASVLEKATGEEIGRYADAGPADVDRAVSAAVRAQESWAAALPDERAWVLRRAADLLRGRSEEFIEIIMRETGSVRAKAAGEVAAAQRKFHESAALPGRAAGEILPPFKPGKQALSQRVPLGVVAVITPWNFPVVLGLRPLGPALALGNTVVMKPAELTPIAGGQLLAEVLADAGLPAGVFNLVTGDGPTAGQPLAEHPDVAMIHFTGSNEIGRLMARIAAEGFKRTSLELGGSNAFVVLEDADIEAASACGAWAAYEFQGQTCISASRHIVHRAVAAQYRDAVVARARRLRVGDPYRADVELGPLISEVQRDRVHKEIVEASVAMGAQVVEGGRYDGLFYRPTVLDAVTPQMPAFIEEIFGPVVPITVVDSEEEALALTNSVQALVNAVYTGDVDRGFAFAQRVKCGLVQVNDAMGRPTGEDDLEEFTQRRFIGVQRAPLDYPTEDEAGHAGARARVRGTAAAPPRAGSGHQHRPAGDPAGRHVVQYVGRRLQRVQRGVDGHLPPRDEVHQVDQVAVRTDLVADDGELPIDHVEVFDPDAAAVSDNGVHPALGEHAHRVFGHVTLAHEVQDDLGAPTRCQVQYRLRGRCGRQFEHRVRAEPAGHGGAAGVGLHDQDPGRGEQSQQLHRDLADPAGADRDDSRRRCRMGREALDRVDRGETGVGVRCQRRRVGAVRQPHQRACAGAQQFGVSAGPPVHSREPPRRAVHVLSRTACRAVPAGDRRVHDDRITHREVVDRRTDLVDPAAVLVAEGQRQDGVERLCQLTLQDMQVGTADSRARDPHDHVMRFDDLGLGDVGEGDGGAVRRHLRGSHTTTPDRRWYG